MELNHLPIAYKASALTGELQALIKITEQGYPQNSRQLLEAINNYLYPSK